MSNKTKNFISVTDIDVIAKWLGEKDWAKYIKLPREQRMDLGVRILRKIQQEEADGKQ